LGHTAKFCPQYHSQNASANYSTTSTRKEKLGCLIQLPLIISQVIF
jgi:hypothetical protein